MSLFKLLLTLIYLGITVIACSQQYPWWTQYRNNQTLYNPAFCGTKRIIDVRMNYRNQWVGFDGAPKTYALSLNGRLLKGRIGLGGFIFKDDIGPFKKINSSITAAYHFRFPDSELSFGVQGNRMSQRFNGQGITLKNQNDIAINQFIEDKAIVNDVSFGVVYYNDRFHIGLGLNNITSSSFKYYKDDISKKGIYKNVPHYNFSAGYNYSDNQYILFENSLHASYINGLPFSFDYTLRIHIMKQIITGLSFRLNDAVALHIGCSIKQNFQIIYSYDIVTSALRKHNRGTHELSCVFSSNLGLTSKKRGSDNRFLKQKYQYLIN